MPKAPLQSSLAVVCVLGGIAATSQASPTQDGEPLRAVYRMADPIATLPTEVAPDQEVAAESGPTVIYLNRCVGGCTITYSPVDDSRANQSAIADYPTVTLTEFNKSDADWDYVVSCARDLFAPFDFKIVTEDPGNVPHHEAVVAGYPMEMLKKTEDLDPAKVGGIALLGCSGGIANSMTYTYASYVDDLDFICATIGQEVAHTFGLDHQLLCDDPMTYLPVCGPKAFQDVAASCGEKQTEPRACKCTQAGTQNSYSFIASRYGTDAPPSVSIRSMATGDRLAPGDFVQVDATDNRRVERVDLEIDGEVVATASSSPFELEIPAGLQAGTRTLTVTAYDDRLIGASTDVQVQIAECTGPEHCTSGTCEQDHCVGGDDDGNGGGTGLGDDGTGDVVGGCQAAGSGAGTGALVWILLALVVWRRKRLELR